MKDIPETTETDRQTALSRRKALARLGIAAGVTVYVAPLLTGLKEAAAQTPSGHSGGCPPGQHRSMGTCV